MGYGEIMSSKQQRQQMVTRLIAHDNVSSQPHLQELLKAQGIEATQATISRDLEELGAVKIRIAGGGLYLCHRRVCTRPRCAI